MKKRRDRFYTHFDSKKRAVSFQDKVQDPAYVASHGFFPFIQFEMKFKKFTLNHATQCKEKSNKSRNIMYAAHMDRFIYQYYGDVVNDFYNKTAKQLGINKVSTAYRNNFKGKTNIHFAKEVFEKIVEKEKAFIFLGDFEKFFDNMNHAYLKERIMQLLGEKYIPADHYAVFKNITRYSCIPLDEIAKFKGVSPGALKKVHQERYIESSQEFQELKKQALRKQKSHKGIPQGSSISAVYANVYMIEFDQNMTKYVTARGGFYRRYSDDFIIMLPEKKEEDLAFIQQQIDQVPDLQLQMGKTERYFYENKKLTSKEGKPAFMNYLGFRFDGETVKIRDKSLFKYYSRAYKKIRIMMNSESLQREGIIKKKLYKLYTEISESKKKGSYGNFLTYAKKADVLFGESPLLKSEIGLQIKRHRNKINNRIKRYDNHMIKPKTVARKRRHMKRPNSR